MSKKITDNTAFKEKFKDRMENMGKEGVMGIMKNTENPITKDNENKIDNWANLYNNNCNLTLNFSKQEC